uniref:PGG domain-containing protein n=1 Tax=Chenopodium quinoa TaxID=63459 RepID=A0A803LYD4_CHEQI
MPEDANTVIVFLTIARNKYGDNPLHNLAAYAPCEENTKNIAELLIDIYKNEISSFSKANLSQDLLQCPWLVKNNYGDTPLSLAIAHKNEDLAKYFLSVDENVVIECDRNVLFLAIEKECHTVAEVIFKLIDNKGWTQLLTNDQHLNVLHLAPLCPETLLSSDKIIYDIKDDEDISAIDLLAQECDNNQAWDRMCKRIGLDPRIKTTYFQSKTNLLDVRNSLFVVAALLATITFTAGFTLPGGFNQDTGDALLATKAAFLVFLISDTLALFFSMLVLICLIWSMVYDSSKSLFLIDRSMVLLRLALNSTLLAFMTGVYIVIAPKTLWAAILIIVIMSFLIGISINKTLLYNVLEYLDKLIPSPTKKPKDQIRVVELDSDPLSSTE